MAESSSDPTLEPTRLRFRLTRLSSFDYTQAGAYFVTVCTAGRQCLFGDVVGGSMQPNECGRAVADTWMGLPVHYRRVTVHAFSLMPNHVHGVLMLCDAPDEAPAEGRNAREDCGLPEIVRAFKSFSAREVNRIRQSQGEAVWQRSYYEHVIRSEESLCRISQYIADNPMQWMLDSENPEVGPAGAAPRRG
ncbi:MAG: transposase [Dehalococcoidia bacterium]|nr:transposase [Dehalococcoidia bacterium]